MRRGTGFSPPPRGPPPPRKSKSGFSRDARSPAAKALGKPKRQSKFSDGPAPKRPRDDNDDAAARAKATLRDLQAKYRARKRKLYGVISLLGLVDALLFYRIASCRGSFFC